MIHCDGTNVRQSPDTACIMNYRDLERTIVLGLLVCLFNTIYISLWLHDTSLQASLEDPSLVSHLSVNSMLHFTNSTLDIVLSSPLPNISAAVCHRTLYGDISLRRIKLWSDFYRSLGFDHIYFWYKPHVESLENFQVVNETSYITLSKYDGNGAKEGQARSEMECLSFKARHYDWVFVADSDEFLWMSGYTNVKAFLELYSNVTYLSFGKWMYSVQHSIKQWDSNEDSYVTSLAKHPFTAGPFCYGKMGRIDQFDCSGWIGRSKLMIKPSVHNRVFVHGDGVPQKGIGLHFNMDVAHIKEWPGWQLSHPSFSEAVHAPADVLVTSEIEVSSLHNARISHKWNKNGTLTLTFDRTLRRWLERVRREV